VNSRPAPSRRAFLGLAAAAAATSAAVVAAVRSAGSGRAVPASAARPGGPAVRRKVVSENQLPGDPDWAISHVGEPDAMTGYAGRCSVLPGESATRSPPSTTSGLPSSSDGLLGPPAGRAVS
jgi:hypothetical protein